LWFLTTWKLANSKPDHALSFNTATKKEKEKLKATLGIKCILKGIKTAQKLFEMVPYGLQIVCFFLSVCSAWYV
jgi:hypothetical protein